MTVTRRLQIIVDQSGNASSGINILTESLSSGIPAAASVAVGALAGVTAAAIGVGAAAISAWSNFDAASDALIVGTGASGDALAEMEQQVLSLSESTAGVGQGLEDIGQVMAEVSKRTGATGKTLETFSGKMLKLNRLTGVDGVRATQLITRAMGDWGVEIEDSADLVDKLFLASQKTGTGVDTLAAQIVQFGAPLRQMGFTLDESIALFAKWEQEGVNAELVMGSLRIAAGNFANENIPLRDGLLQTMEAIRGAKDESAGLAIAMDVFGARAGPDMAAAIREGRFSIDELVAALGNAEGTLDQTADATLDFSDRFGLQMQRVQNSLIPVGQAIMDFGDYVVPGITTAVDAMTSFIDRVTAAYQERGLKGVIEVISADLAALGEEVGFQFSGVILPMVRLQLSQLEREIITWATQKGPEIKAKLLEWADGAWDWITRATQQASTKLNDLTTSIRTWADGEGKSQLNQLGRSIGSTMVDNFVELVTDKSRVASAMRDMIAALVGGAIELAGELLDIGLEVGAGIIQGILDRIAGVESSNAVRQTLKDALVRSLVGLNPFLIFHPAGQDSIRGITAAINSGTPELTRASRGAISAAKASALQEATSTFPAVGRAADDGVVRGINAGVPAIESAARRAARKAYNAAMNELNAHSPSQLFADKVGEEAMAGGIVMGLERGGNAISGAARGVVAGAASDLVSGASGGAAAPIVVQLTYAPVISTADRLEAENVLAPFIAEGVRNYLAGRR